MATHKIAITLDRDLLQTIDRLVSSGEFPSRSRAIAEALHESLERRRRSRLAIESRKLDPAEERRMADEVMNGDTWFGS